MSVAGILNTMGTVLENEGKLGRAERLYERALTIYERELDSDDPRIGFPLVNLANNGSMQGKLDGVGAMYRRHLAIQQKVYGPKHPRVGLSLNNLGDFMSKAGTYEEAIPMLRQALEVFSTSLGPEHADVAVVLSALGDAELASSRPREARVHYRRSVTVREQALADGQFDAFFAHSLVRLGGIEAELGDEAAAAQNLNRAAAMLRDAPEAVDVQLAPALLNLGRWLAERQRCDEAVPLLQRIVHIHAARQSPPSAATAELERLLAGCEVQPPTPAAG